MKTVSPIIALVFSLLPPVVSAITVTTSADEDDGSLRGGSGISLREAVMYSQSGASITFAPGLSGKTLRLSRGSLVINQSITIDASSLPGGLTLSADRTGDGKTADDTYPLLFTRGTLLLDSLTLTGANCGESAGCITIEDKSQVSLILNRCTLTGNTGYHGAALYAYGYTAGDSITIRNSTIARNSAVKGAAGLNVYGYAVAIQNSTFTANSGGAVYFSNGPLSINYATITGNTASVYGYSGIYVGSHSNNVISIQNTLCAGNSPANKNGFAFTGTNNLFTGTPRLAPLGNYGGPTQTMPPLPGSTALSGSATYTDLAEFPTDQRGISRRIDSYHIGAAHYQNDSDIRRFWNLDFDGDGSAFGIEAGLGTDSLVPDAASSRNLAVSTLDPSGHPVLRFGRGPIVSGFSSAGWVVKRSTTLSPDSFQEIFRFTLYSATAQPGITYSFDSNGSVFSVIDTTAPAGGAFYRIEGVNP